MTAPIVFEVPGIAQPQGSARAYTYHRRPEKGGGIGARVDSDNVKLKAWRKDVARAAVAAGPRGGLLLGPVRVVAEFYLPAPKTRRRDAHITRPDGDKLLRAVNDAITGVLIRDDAQVTQGKFIKCYVRPGEGPRAVIAVTPLAERGLL